MSSRSSRDSSRDRRRIRRLTMLFLLLLPLNVLVQLWTSSSEIVLSRNLWGDWNAINGQVWTTENSTTSELVVVVPGLGDATRIPVLQKSLTGLLATTEQVSCIVYVWNKTLVDEATDKLKLCTVTYNEGLWTNHMLRANDSVIGNATHVAVLIDDIDVSAVNVSSFLSTIHQAGYDVASASIPGWHYKAMHPRAECKSHRTDFADVLFLVYTRQAWRCWQQQIDLTVNEFGWGYDVTFAEKCNVTVGIIDEAIARHQVDCANGGDCTRSYNGAAASRQQMDWFQHATELPREQLRQYWEYVVYKRPQTFPYCDEFQH